MQLTSPAFISGTIIPRAYTCKGENKSPELNWSEPPAGTKSFALIVEDPDAPHGTYTHWIAYNIPPNFKHLPEDLGEGNKSQGLFQGKNDFGRAAYGGPCPPRGDKPHRYFFRLYALDARIDLPAGATRAELEDAMLEHIIAQGELMGKYKVN